MGEERSGDLYFFECADVVSGFFAGHGDAAERLRDAAGIVSFDVDGTVLFQERGFSPLTTADLFGKRGHERALERSDGIVQLIDSLLVIEDGLGLSWSYRRAFLFYHRLIVQEMSYVLEVMQSALERLAPARILIPDYRSSFRDSQLKISARDRILGIVGERFARLNGVECVDFGVALSFTPSMRSSLFAGAWKLGNDLLYRFGAWRYKGLDKSRSVIMALGTSYGMNRLVPKLKLQGDVVTYVTGSGYLKQNLSRFLKGEWITLAALGVGEGRGDERFESTLAQSIDAVAGQVDNALFSIYGVNLWEATELYVRHPLSASLKQLAARAARLARLLEKRKPRLILAQHALGLGGVLGELSQRYDTPSILVSHGSHVPVTGRFDRIEWVEHSRNMIDAPYRYAALQTPLAEAFVEQIGLQWAQALKTGPLLFGKTHPKQDRSVVRSRLLDEKLQGKSIVMHASTPKSRSGRRFFVYETVEEYVAGIRALIGAVEQVPEAHLIVRFRPSPDLGYETLRRLLPDSSACSIRMDGGFADFLAASDLLVSFGSTTIEEALLNEIPVLQYDPDARYVHIDAETFAGDRFGRTAACSMLTGNGIWFPHWSGL